MSSTELPTDEYQFQPEQSQEKSDSKNADEQFIEIANLHVTDEQLPSMQIENKDMTSKLKQSDTSFNKFERAAPLKYRRLSNEKETVKHRSLNETQNESDDLLYSKTENVHGIAANQLEKISMENLKLKAELDKIKADQRADAYKSRRQDNAYNDNIMLRKEVEKLKEEVKRSKLEIDKMTKDNMQKKMDATKIGEQNMKLKGESLQLERYKKDKIKLEKDIELMKEERAKEKIQMEALSKEIDRLKKIVEDEQEIRYIREEKDVKQEDYKLEISKLQGDKTEMQEEIVNQQSKIISLNQEVVFGKEDVKKLKNQLSAHTNNNLQLEKQEKANEELKNEIEKLEGELRARNIENKRKQDDFLKEIGQLKKLNEKFSDQVMIRRNDDMQLERYKKDVTKMAKDAQGLIEEIKNLKSTIAVLKKDKDPEMTKEDYRSSKEEPSKKMSDQNPPNLMNDFLKEMSNV